MRTIQLRNMKKKENSLVVLSNSIVKSRYSLSLPTQKLLLFLISKITYEERKEGKFLNTLVFSLDEIYNLLRHSGRNNSNDLKEVLKNFVQEISSNAIKVSQINKKGKEVWESWAWSQYSKIDESIGTFVFKFNQDVSPLLLSLQNYFKSDINEYLHLSSSHAISLYMLFRSNEFKNKTQSYYIEEFKEILGIKDKYERWEAFKRIVLDPSMFQLNKETNYFFTYEAKRIGRSIGKIEITVIDKKNKGEFSNYFSEKIQDFLKKEKAKPSVRKNFTLVYYEFNAKENCLYISFKEEKTLKNLIKQNHMFGLKATSSSDILQKLLDKHISNNKSFQKYIKSMFRKGFKIFYK